MKIEFPTFSLNQDSVGFHNCNSQHQTVPWDGDLCLKLLLFQTKYFSLLSGDKVISDISRYWGLGYWYYGHGDRALSDFCNIRSVGSLALLYRSYSQPISIICRLPLLWALVTRMPENFFLDMLPSLLEISEITLSSDKSEKYFSEKAKASKRFSSTNT